MPKFTRGQLQEMLQPLLQYYPERDRALIADRVCETVLIRQRQGRMTTFWVDRVLPSTVRIASVIS